MQARPQPAPSVKRLSLDVRAGLLRKVQPIRHSAIELKRSTSIARRSQMYVMVGRLSDRVCDLDPPADVWRYNLAIVAAFASHDWDAIIAACEPFEAMLEGETPQYPIEAALAACNAPPSAAAPDTAAVPAPPAAEHAPAPTPPPAAEPPAIPVAVRNAPAPSPADPKPEQAKLAAVANDHVGTVPANDDAPVTIGGIATVEKLGEAIRLGRVSKRMTQQEVATAAGVGRRFVVELESGKGKSEIGRIFAVCQVVGVTLTATTT